MSSAGADGRDDGLTGVRPLAPGDPRRIGSYALLGRLGAGGMGRVFLARSAGGRTVAVKVVHEEHASDDHFRARFRREINAARRVGERYTAPVLDADPDAELPWVATGYVPGPSLEHVVRQYGPLPADSVRVLADGLLRALKDIHAAGIVHRDLKPSNVMLTVEGPRVIDFGIARALDASVESLLTSTGMVIGSPGFMAPEQILGQEVGVASDVFALGCVLMYAATGQLPFGQDVTNQHAVMYRIVEGEPQLDAVADQALRELIGHCLAKDPEQRPGVETLLEAAEQERPAGAGPASGEWLPAKLVVALAQQAARLLDADAGVDAGAEASGGRPAGGVPEAGASSGGDRATVGLRAGGGASGDAPQHVPAEVSPAVPQEGVPERSARTKPARSAERERRRRPLVVGVGLVAVVTVGGGAVLVLQPFQRQQASPPANGRSAAPVNPGAPAPSSPSPSHSKDAKSKDSGGGEQGGGSAKPSAGPAGAGGAGATGGSASGGGTGSSGGATGGGSSGGSDSASGGNNPATGGGSGSGSDSGGNAVPASFVGTWHLTNPYAQQPGKVVISRAADGQQAVRLISDVTGTGHCENVARLESVSAGGSRINLSAASVDQARSNGICGTADPSYFALDDPGGIRHDVGPAHGNGYHYERVN
ncbi:serine/threonine-protein kinase [Streptomyces sp. NPDC057743]|uniref:serine/threonine-protein kinase n=1 Tax=Streptomyces sp. NPDC057743 TaxID=3346236 RepID=UPI0036CDD6BC